jgi:nitroimidazol reductase NimA-like FMN-containing flavoprotein (pyridoxamine 5'-phosphate oxidase superfamily)
MAELSALECEHVLARNGIARLGSYSPEKDQSYVIPVAYAYEPGRIKLELIPGQALHFLTEHPHGVCLEVEEVRQSELWTTVVVTGDIVKIDRNPTELEAIEPRREPLAPIFESGLAPYSPENLVLCELAIREVSGREDRWKPSINGDKAELAKIIGTFKSEHRTGDS